MLGVLALGTLDCRRFPDGGFLRGGGRLLTDISRAGGSHGLRSDFNARATDRTVVNSPTLMTTPAIKVTVTNHHVLGGRTARTHDTSAAFHSDFSRNRNRCKTHTQRTKEEQSQTEEFRSSPFRRGDSRHNRRDNPHEYQYDDVSHEGEC